MIRLKVEIAKKLTKAMRLKKQLNQKNFYEGLSILGLNENDFEHLIDYETDGSETYILAWSPEHTENFLDEPEEFIFYKINNYVRNDDIEIDKAMLLNGCWEYSFIDDISGIHV